MIKASLASQLPGRKEDIPGTQEEDEEEEEDTSAEVPAAAQH